MQPFYKCRAGRTCACVPTIKCRCDGTKIEIAVDVVRRLFRDLIDVVIRRSTFDVVPRRSTFPVVWASVFGVKQGWKGTEAGCLSI